MVGYDPLKKKLTAYEKTVVSAATSVLTRALIHPFDVVKIRFQVQYEPISKRSQSSKYKSITQTVSTIVREEGLFALWKGHLTGQILSMSFITAQFLWFEFFTKIYHDLVPSSATSASSKSLGHFISGGLAACCTVAMNQPVDTIRTRFVSQGEPRVYTSIPDAVRKIYTREGVRGYYRGLLPSMLLYAPESAFRFGIYQALNSKWSWWSSVWQRLFASATTDQDKLPARDVGSLQASVNGALSGVCAKTVVYPFDLIKKRLQVQGFEEARKSFGQVVKLNGVIDCFHVTWHKEGIRGLYKGYYPSMLKAAVSSGLVFFFYEEFSHLMRKLS